MVVAMAHAGQFTEGFLNQPQVQLSMPFMTHFMAFSK